jgi:hypothetical protein
VGDAALMRLLLDKGADANRAMKSGTTALMVTVNRQGRLSGPDGAPPSRRRRCCLERGADINAANANGDTALHVAVTKGDELVKFLVEKGATLDAKDKYNRTAARRRDGRARRRPRPRRRPRRTPPVYEKTRRPPSKSSASARRFVYVAAGASDLPYVVM